jgi:hypothetical protein
VHPTDSCQDLQVQSQRRFRDRVLESATAFAELAQILFKRPANNKKNFILTVKILQRLVHKPIARESLPQLSQRDNWAITLACAHFYQQALFVSQMNTLIVAAFFSSVSALCPIGHQSFNNYCYFLSLESRQWFDAEKHCNEYGGFLTSVHNGFEKAALQS